jgi:hypothetical protein
VVLGHSGSYGGERPANVPLVASISLSLVNPETSAKSATVSKLCLTRKLRLSRAPSHFEGQLNSRSLDRTSLLTVSGTNDDSAFRYPVVLFIVRRFYGRWDQPDNLVVRLSKGQRNPMRLDNLQTPPVVTDAVKIERSKNVIPCVFSLAILQPVSGRTRVMF